MGLESTDSKNSFWSIRDVCDDNGFRDVNRTREKAGRQYGKGFVWEDIHDLFRYQLEMFGGVSLGVFSSVERFGRTLCLHFYLRHGRNGDLPRFLDFPDSVSNFKGKRSVGLGRKAFAGDGDEKGLVEHESPKCRYDSIYTEIDGRRAR